MRPLRQMRNWSGEKSLTSSLVIGFVFLEQLRQQEGRALHGAEQRGAGAGSLASPSRNERFQTLETLLRVAASTVARFRRIQTQGCGRDAALVVAAQLLLRLAVSTSLSRKVPAPH